MKKTLLLLFIVQCLMAQDIPFVVDHPIYIFLDRQESLGRIEGEYWSTKPYTYGQINSMLEEVGQHKLNPHEQKILIRFQHELFREIKDEGVRFPWSESNLRNLLISKADNLKPFFMTYKKGETQGWINWAETFRLQNNGKVARGYFTDHLGIYGVKGRISFTSQYSYHRLTKNNEFPELPDSYKEGYILNRDYIDWITWDYPNSSLTYTHPDFTFGIHRQPVQWGYSATNSPILSDNVNPLPHVLWQTESDHIRYKFIHARLSPNSSSNSDTLNIRRNLSAHRVEFDISPNFEFAFNELLVYAYRDFELAYLNPVNFLFAEEHVQGDLDNLLMALEFKWRTLNGLTTYGTWFFDELDFFKLFSGWWGNKFVFQIGATYYPNSNLPSLNIEYTAARPWTYSHEDPANSFTSADRILGLKAGPNTASLAVNANWQVGPKLFLSSKNYFLRRGDDPGADVFTSYDERGNFEQEDTSFIRGNIGTTLHSSISIDYQLRRTAYLSVAIIDGSLYEIGLKLDW